MDKKLGQVEKNSKQENKKLKIDYLISKKKIKIIGTDYYYAK